MGLSQWMERRRANTQARKSEAAKRASEAARARLVTAAQPRPLPPSTVRLSAAGRLAVVGESHYQPALNLAADGAAVHGIENAVRTWCALVPEPENRYDRHAVRVDCLTSYGAVTVGYLARELARDYQPILRTLPTGVVGICPGQIMGGGAKFYGIWLSVADPSSLLMTSQPSSSQVVVNPDQSVAVTGEQDFHASLAALHGGGSQPVRHYASLRPVAVTRGKHAGEQTLEVVIADQVVRQLTQTMGQRYLPLFPDGSTRCCEATITPGEKRFEVTLRLPKVR